MHLGSPPYYLTNDAVAAALSWWLNYKQFGEIGHRRNVTWIHSPYSVFLLHLIGVLVVLCSIERRQVSEMKATQSCLSWRDATAEDALFGSPCMVHPLRPETVPRVLAKQQGAISRRG